MRETVEREPIFNAPAIVVGLLAGLVAIHVGRQFLTDEAGTWWLLALAFVPARYTGAFGDIPGGSIASVTSFLTHAGLHGDAVHLAVNGAWLLAFGSPLARRIHTVRFLLLFIGSAIAGALLYLAVNYRSDSIAIMIGASGAISGLAGAAFRFLFRAMEARDPEGLGGAATWVPRMSLTEMLRDRRARVAVAAWIVLNFVFAAAGPLFGWASAIAWEAHLGGFLFGLLTFSAIDRIKPPPEVENEVPTVG